MQLLIENIINIIVAVFGSSEFFSSVCIAPFVFMLFVNIVRLFKLITASL